MKVIHCPCGEEVSGVNDDEIVDNVTQHIKDKHPEMAGNYTREQILSMAQDH